jgi:hypothetical protein
LECVGDDYYFIIVVIVILLLLLLLLLLFQTLFILLLISVPFFQDGIVMSEEEICFLFQVKINCIVTDADQSNKTTSMGTDIVRRSIIIRLFFFI